MLENSKDAQTNTAPGGEACPMWPVEQLALRFTRAWHRHPELHEALLLDGVNLGEVMEYQVYPRIEKAFREHPAEDLS